MKKSKNNLLKEIVISRIKNEKLQMRPRFYFLLEAVFVFILGFLLFSFALYFGSLIVFVLRENNFFLFYGTGLQGMRIAFSAFPWHTITFILTLVLGIEVIVRKFSLIHRKPFIYSILGMVFLIFVGGLLIDRTSVHGMLFEMAQQDELPVGGRMYRRLGNVDFENTYFGRIITEEEDGWMLKTEKGEKIILKVGERSRGKRMFLDVRAGNEVLVIGETSNGTVDVLGFRKINGRLRSNER